MLQAAAKHTALLAFLVNFKPLQLATVKVPGDLLEDAEEGLLPLPLAEDGLLPLLPADAGRELMAEDGGLIGGVFPRRYRPL